jgi:beta-phosphoglucomutase-like phosphatase (HAD superfamily)
MPRGKKASGDATVKKPAAQDKLAAEVKELKASLKETTKLITGLDKRLSKLEAKGAKAPKASGAKRGRKPKAKADNPEEVPSESM